MELSELFLLAWAFGATFAAGYFHNKLQRASKGAIVLCLMIEAIADGKAKLVRHPDGRMTMDMGDHEVTLRETQE